MIGSELPPSPDAPERPRQQRFARLALSLALLALGAWTLHGFIAALVWATILAVAVGPVYAKAVRRWPPGPHNLLMPLLFTLAVAVVFLLPFVLLGVQAAREAHDVIGFASDAMKNGVPVPDAISHLPFGATSVGQWWQTNLGDATAVSEFTHGIVKSMRAISPREFGIAVTHRVVTFFFTLVTLFFILRHADDLAAEMLRASERMFGPHGERIGRQIVASIHGTVDGLVLVGLGEGVLLGIAFALAGVPHPTLLGALAAVAAMIPFVIIVILVLVGIVLVAQGAIGAAVAVVGFGLVMNFVADHFIRPGLIGGATKLPFLWVLLGVLGGVETWGLIGLFVGPALMSALILLWRELVRSEPLLDVKPARPGRTLSPVPIAGE